MKNMAEKIKSLKKELGLTNKMISIRTNIPKSTLDKIFSGETKNPAITYITSIARTLGVTADYLIDDNINDPNYGKEFLENMQPIIYAIDEDSEMVEKLDDNQIAEYLNELASLPKSALVELRIVLDYLKFKYKDGDNNGQ